MSARKRSLLDFDDLSNSEPEQKHVTVNDNTKTEQSEGTDTMSTVEEKVTDIHNNEPEQGFIQVFQNKKKPTVEETHTRQTYLIRNELIAELEQLAKGQDRGFKTQLVNYALEKAIRELKGTNV